MVMKNLNIVAARVRCVIVCIMLLALMAGCSNENAENGTSFADIDTEISTDDGSLPGEYTQYEDYIEAGHTSNPFAEALLEYFAGGAETSPTGFSSTKAFWIDADGNGTKGVLAIRHEENFPFGRIFYLYDGELSYKDVGHQDAGFVTSITVEGNRAVNLMGDGGQSSRTLFSIENGELIADFTMFVQGDYPYDHYYYFSGGLSNWENRRSITKEEFNEIEARYGLDNLRGPWWDMDDETDQILAMTFQ